MTNYYVWAILGIITIILLIAFWGRRNAAWGGLTIGLIAWFIAAMFKNGLFNWFNFSKFIIVGAIIGFGAESLGMLSKQLSKKP